MEVVFLLAAEQDLQQAYNWVAEHRHGKEQSFLHDIESRRCVPRCNGSWPDKHIAGTTEQPLHFC
jgi:hypothetical protein